METAHRRLTPTVSSCSHHREQCLVPPLILGLTSILPGWLLPLCSARRRNGAAVMNVAKFGPAYDKTLVAWQNNGTSTGGTLGQVREGSMNVAYSLIPQGHSRRKIHLWQSESKQGVLGW